MGKIFCLMGKSSSGKDTIFKRILEEGNVELNTVVPYTTRPIREGEVNGVEYYFTDEEGFAKLKNDGKIIEDRAYNTAHGLWRYFTVDDGKIALEKNNYIIIGTLEAFEKIKNHFGQEKVVPIMIEIEDGERLQRALDREKKPENRKYEEMCRRFLADCKDFSEEKINAAGITRRFINDDLNKCFDEVISYIKDYK